MTTPSYRDRWGYLPAVLVTVVEAAGASAANRVAQPAVVRAPKIPITLSPLRTDATGAKAPLAEQSQRPLQAPRHRKSYLISEA